MGTQWNASLPASGGVHDPDVSQSSLAGIVSILAHLTLPCATLTLVYLAEYSLVAKTAVLEVSGRAICDVAMAFEPRVAADAFRKTS